MSHRKQAPGRGVARRNAKLKELRRLVSRDRAVLEAAFTAVSGGLARQPAHDTWPPAAVSPNA